MGSAQFLLYVKDVLSDFSTREFSEPGRLPISLAFPAAPFPSEWSPAEADGADAASGGALSPPSQLFWPTYDGVREAGPDGVSTGIFIHAS